MAPHSGELFSLIVDGVDGDVFRFFLDEMARAVPRKEGMRQLLILDNASWHKSARLNWHHFEVKLLPGYSPDFNPIERLWLRLKADWFWDFIARTPEELSDQLCLALKSFINDPAKTASNCSLRKWLLRISLKYSQPVPSLRVTMAATSTSSPDHGRDYFEELRSPIRFSAGSVLMS